MRHTNLFRLYSLAVFGVSSIVAALFGASPVSAQVYNWDAGNIISDSVFTDISSMSASQIQAVLDSKIASCDTWGTQPSEFGGGTRRQWAESRGYSAPFTCLKDYSQNGKSAAQIIYDVAQKYSINPRVLIVLLQKEQGLVTDTWPLNIQYRSATGYGCPDTAPCDSQYYGLTNQLDWAGKMFRAIMNASPTWYTPYVLGSNYIRYNPNASCGGSTVNIQNRATQALYNYTPYQPNSYALNGGSNSAYPDCGAFGNRNFYTYYTNWFGPTRYIAVGGILEQYNQVGGYAKLGFPLMNEYCGLRDGACYQNFERGSIYWTPAANRAYTLFGGILAGWASMGKEWGVLGYPVGNEQYGANRVIQEFENGTIFYLGGKTLYILKQINYGAYQYLGDPIRDTVCGLVSGGCYQMLSGGAVYWSDTTGSYSVFGGIGAKWASAGKEWGVLGYPISNEEYAASMTVQKFQNGGILYMDGKAQIVLDRMKYLTNYTYLGSPKTDTICGTRNNGCYQAFANGYIYQTESTDAHAIFGGIYDKWASAGKEWGVLGYPISNEEYAASMTVQKFEHGEIRWAPQSGAVIVQN